ncbi:MAG TPA: DUF4350 domain-containing protein [Bacteroidia bacterium]|nr:DUF4350 domain-containing protein [Bacteroidia bacterium]
MKAERKYIFLLVTIFILLVVVEYNQPKPVDWEPTFSKKDKIPYGNFVVYDYLSDIFPGKKIVTADKGLYRTLGSRSEPCNNYIIITDSFWPDTLDLDYLKEYVKSGHNVFVSANHFDGTFSDSMKFSCKRNYILDVLSKDSTSINFTAKEIHAEKDFKYKKGTVEHYFELIDSVNTTVLGRNSKGQINYMAIKYGEGTFYLSCVPYAFTNYNALKGKNGEYIYRALSYLPVADTYWDEYYKPGDKTSGTPIGFILGNNSLKAAYYVMILGLLLYILFEGKRKQRIIPIITPLKNTSLEFVETIGRLYYQKGTRSGIAHKKIIFFLDFIRTRYNIATNVFNESFYTALASKTLIPADELQSLFTFITQVQAAPAIDEVSLMKLNNQIENFYRKTQ